MKLKVSLLGQGETSDVQVTVNSLATVGDLADALAERDPARHERWETAGSWSLRLHRDDTDRAGMLTLPAEDLVVESRLRSGAVVSLAPLPSDFGDPAAMRGPTAAILTVVSGPCAGTRHELPAGVSTVGRSRDCDVWLDDPLVSKRHARITVAERVELVDAQSANGMTVGGSTVERAVLRSDDVAVLGATGFVVNLLARSEGGLGPGEGTVEVLRSPRVVTRFDGEEVDLPEVPSKPTRQRFPFLVLIAPLLIGAGLYAITRNSLLLVFILLSPLMTIGSWVDQRSTSRRTQREEEAEFCANLADLRDRLQALQVTEREVRLAEHPSTAEVVEAHERLAPLLWARRPDLPGFLTLRLGLGTQPSRTTVKSLGPPRGRPELARELRDVVAGAALIESVPVVVDLASDGALGVAGASPVVDEVARALLLQLTGTHSPGELVVTCVAGNRSAATWDWLKWLPHVASVHSPLGAPHLASSPGDVGALMSQLEELIALRTLQRRPDERVVPPELLPTVVLLIAPGAPVERYRQVQIAEQGPAAGVYVIWLAASVDRLPAACHVFLDLQPEPGRGLAGYVRRGAVAAPLECDGVPMGTALRIARISAPFRDVGARVDDDTNLPRSVSFASLAGEELLDDSEAVLDRWRQSDSMIARDGSPPRRRRLPGTLRTVVGQAGLQPITLDLRAQGPHALVGGTTGSGKSEFLQAWIVGMALAYSPDRVTFLLVDYKGGSAFKECVDLPHCVGLVTDLSPAMVRRALTSLRAELHHRERLLNDKGVKDMASLEESGDPDCLPSLVIVVDEFAALVHDVPDFVDGVVDVAARGRSLGLHLVLATQRPAGVIRDNLRANTNLRVALRMNDDDDSVDVLGVAMAASFDPTVPGRAAVRTGPARVTTFQSGYAGGHTTGEPAMPEVDVEGLGFTGGGPWQVPDQGVDRPVAEPGPSDIARLVATVGLAASSGEVPRPRRPWQPELARCYDARRLSQRTDSEVVFGVVDVPASQAQRTVHFRPDLDGNMAIYGTGGSGKSTLLRTVGVSAGISPRGGPVQVYGIDFGSGGLALLDHLPHVGAIITGDDHERIARLVRRLREIVEGRGVRYAADRSSTIVEYRKAASRPGEARILLLVDGLAAFRQEYEFGPRADLFQSFQQIASDGRPLGVHVVLTADRPATVPPSLGASIQRRVVLRLANEADYGLLDVEDDVLNATSPPGRGMVDGLQLQVAVWGGSGVLAEQARAVTALARSATRAAVVAAPPVERLAPRVALSSLLPIDGQVVLGLSDETLAPFGLDWGGTFLVAGPPGSGRTTSVAGLASAVRRARPGVTAYYFGNRRSPLPTMAMWTATAVGAGPVQELAKRLTKELGESDGAVLVLIESPTDFLGGEAEQALQGLVQACREQRQMVVADGEPAALTQTYPLLQALKAERRGIVLQPDQSDGDSIFRTAFPRITRGEFPPGRGLLVSGGRLTRVQMALPE